LFPLCLSSIPPNAAQSREEEEKRVNKEIANIRSKFKGEICLFPARYIFGDPEMMLLFTSEGKLNSYDKKKYVCKMLYIYILGYELDFGHVEAYNLITGKLYTEKQIVSPCHLPSPLSSPTHLLTRNCLPSGLPCCQFDALGELGSH